MSIIIGADFVPTEPNRQLFEAGSVTELLGEKLAGLLRQADFRIVNLEMPLTDRETPIAKKGPVLRAPAACGRLYREAGISLVTLANNHILDQGPDGLRDTLRVLEQNGVSHVGAGAPEEAAKPFCFDYHGKRVGVLACAEHEFSVALPGRPGANPFDPLETPDQVSALRQQCDYVIVLYHGGKEYYRYPSPGLRKTCRKLAEKGADLVLCQHSHCIGCAETVGDSTIVYGQGNFLFREPEGWNTGLLVCLDENLRVSYLPLLHEQGKARLAEGAEADTILNAFNARGEELRQPGFAEQKYRELAKQSLSGYLYALGGRETKAFRLLNKLTGGKLRRAKFGRREKLAVRNFIECETHRELLLKGLTPDE